MDVYAVAEGLALVLTLGYVGLAIVQSVWCWPSGFLGAGLTLVVCLHARLYGMAVLQLVYMALMVYGWHEWRQGGEDGGGLRVSRTPLVWAIGLTVTGALSAVAMGLFLNERTDAVLPFWDAGTTAFSLVAQLMTTRKWIENWLVWLVVDGVYVGMFVSQDLFLMASLYLALIVFAAAGFLQWRRCLRGEHPASTT